MHALYERLPATAPAERRGAADQWLLKVQGVKDAPVRAEIIESTMSIIEDPAFADLFSTETLAEAPIAAVVGEEVIAGTVDRLLVTGSLVRVVDFKTGRFVPEGPDDVPRPHLRQMAAYSAALEVIFPGRRIEAALLYTAGPKMVPLPPDLLRLHKPGFPGAQQEFP